MVGGPPRVLGIPWGASGKVRRSPKDCRAPRIEKPGDPGATLGAPKGVWGPWPGDTPHGAKGGEYRWTERTSWVDQDQEGPP